MMEALLNTGLVFGRLPEAYAPFDAIVDVLPLYDTDFCGISKAEDLEDCRHIWAPGGREQSL